MALISGVMVHCEIGGGFQFSTHPGGRRNWGKCYIMFCHSITKYVNQTFFIKIIFIHREEIADTLEKDTGTSGRFLPRNLNLSVANPTFFLAKKKKEKRNELGA